MSDNYPRQQTHDDRIAAYDAEKPRVSQSQGSPAISQSSASREMTPKEQEKDYERVNGSFDRARAAEVRQYGRNGYQGDPGENAAERRAERQGDATMQHLDRPIANGWTQAEAVSMDRHISAKVGAESVRSEPSNAAYRQAERASDPTDRMHEAGRERQANAYVTQTQRDAGRSQVTATRSDAQVSQRQQQAQQPSQGITR